MKKRITLTLFTLLSIFLTACGTNSTDIKYNVYFFTANTNATIIPTVFDLEPGVLLDAPQEDPIRPGFEFAGWYADITYTTPWDFDNDRMPEASIVLYAKWISETKSITYFLNGGEMTTLNYITEFTPGTNVVLPRARRVGHVFKGWFLYPQDFERFPNSGGTRPGEIPLISINPTIVTDLELYAHWSLIEVAVSFRSDHPSGLTVVPNPATQRFNYGTVIEFGVNFPGYTEVIDNYIFVGWNTRADKTGTLFVNGSVFIRTATVTLYGQWIPA
jgi:uncharacterized repeat protein (TIGR02543 family)